jgi:predicted AAA+ superfamily ATPase
VVKDYSSNISKASVNRAIDWLYSAGIIGFAGKITDCNILDFKAKSRCYFMDLGLARYYLEHIGCSDGDIAGIISENYVYLDLKRRTNHPSEIALETPAFATLGNGEIDFYVKSIRSKKTYAIEVKAGKKNSKTIQDVLDKNKADYVVFAKGNTHGGIKDNVYTIPIYGISKFKF